MFVCCVVHTEGQQSLMWGLVLLQAKQRASVAWIVQKAHKNKVPTDLQDPYYRDYEVRTVWVCGGEHAVLCGGLPCTTSFGFGSFYSRVSVR